MNSLSQWRVPLLGLWLWRTASCRLPLCQGVPACKALFLLWLCSPKRFLSDLKAVIWLDWNLSYFWRKLQDHDVTWWTQLLRNWQRSRAGVRPEILLHLLLFLSCIAELEILKLDTALSMPPPSSSGGTTLWSIGGRLGGRQDQDVKPKKRLQTHFVLSHWLAMILLASASPSCLCKKNHPVSKITGFTSLF